jgi:hypothetical protein
MEERIAGKTKHGEITIDQLAQIQPGMARLMDEISRRFYYLYYAAKGGNWPMAKHQYNETIAVMNIVKVTRPKYTQDMETFEKHHLSPILVAIEHKDWKEFELTYKKAVEGSDFYHDKYNYSYIRFVIPSKPPEHMDFGPPEKFSRKK